MPGRTAVQATVAVAAVVWLAGLNAQGVDVEWSWMRPYSVAVSVAALAWVAFDRWLWRLPGVRQVVKVPDLSGTWKGEVRTEWKARKSDPSAEPTEAYLVVHQTFSTVSVAMLTVESDSETLSATLDHKRHPATLTYTYRNTPRPAVRHRSEPHLGTARLSVHGNRPTAVDGSYWTDRLTKGEMTFRQRVNAHHTRFDDAAAAFAQQGSVSRDDGGSAQPNSRSARS